MGRRRLRRIGSVVVLLVALGAAGCGDDDDSGASDTSPSTSTSTTASTSATTPTTLSPLQVAPAELRGRWIGTAGTDRVTLTLQDGAYQISIPGGGSRFRPKAEYDGDTIRFLTTTDGCDLLAVYRWQVDGATLTLTSIGEDPCENRRFFLGARTFTQEVDPSTTTTA